MMASKKILVEILNKSGPIPNICSIIAHNPDIVLFIIMNNPKGELTEKFDAVKFVKLSSEIIGGQGGGGRKDFAQAGGQDQSKINEAFEKIKSLI